MRKLLFVGLGNPGKRYEYTRHNLGAMVLHAWVASKRGVTIQDWRSIKSWQAEAAQVRLDDAQNISVVVTCLVPILGMNESGRAVAACAAELSVGLQDMVIVHDDLEVPAGVVRWKRKGSAGGHRGVRSIQESLRTQDVPRLRLGIGRPPAGVSPSDFVLQEFTQEELPAVRDMVVQACRVLDTTIVS